VIGKRRAPRNRTLTLSEAEIAALSQQLQPIAGPVELEQICDRILPQNLFDLLDWLPQGCIDLLFLDPPYNLTKSFNGSTFKQRSDEAYSDWLASWLPKLLKTLKPTATVYLCGDWRSSGSLQRIAEQHLIVRNRITWEREKGRGAKANWKNCSEDIWFCTVSQDYCFNADAVRLKRPVIAPYRNAQRQPKDWQETDQGNYRLTSASNLWTDLTVPFWSMPENTDHPTQKPEKLLAKLLLASSNPGDWVLDPFLGSGTTAVVAKKLGRRFVGIEQELSYCCLAQKRLALAEAQPKIQGYDDGVFWARNAL
jgi:site-specific DNA-methyltransferase (adenine-specific)